VVRDWVLFLLFPWLNPLNTLLILIPIETIIVSKEPSFIAKRADANISANKAWGDWFTAKMAVFMRWVDFIELASVHGWYEAERTIASCGTG
jgi:hypothetical protein